MGDKKPVALSQGKSHWERFVEGCDCSMNLSGHPAAIDDQDVAGDVVGCA
jgi:hypothetical protein